MNARRPNAAAAALRKGETSHASGAVYILYIHAYYRHALRKLIQREMKRASGLATDEGRKLPRIADVRALDDVAV